MKVETTALPGHLLLSPATHRDERGWFRETAREDRFAEAGITVAFRQDNISRSREGVLRGLHFQRRYPQAILVACALGRVFDVAVDLRPGSPTFGTAAWVELDGEGGRQAFLPAGFAHGFCVIEGPALVHYKCERLWQSGDDFGVRWDDPSLGIPWPKAAPQVSARDAALPLLSEIPADGLPQLTSDSGRD